MIQPLSSTSRVMMIGISSQDLSLIELGVLARWTIGPRLMGVPGVAHVAIWGNRDRQLQVQVDPKRLRDNGVSLEQVIETTGNAMWVSTLSFVEGSTPGTGGFIDTPQQRLGIRHLFPISSPEGLAKVPIEDSTLTLGDVANVVEDHQPLIGDAILNQGPGLLLVVEKFPGANTLEVTRGVEDALEAMQPGLPGIQIDSTIFRPASYIELATRNLSTVLLIGAVLVVLVLGAFFFGWRTALVSLVVIPLSLIAAVLVLYLRGATFNTMILAGLVVALGAIIDDAIVDVENIARRLRQRRQERTLGQSQESIVLEASLEMRSPIFFAALITLLAVLPIFFVGGTSGSFIRPFAVSNALAVLVSMLVALIVTPALSLTLLANAPLERREPPLVRALQRVYHGLLARTVHASYLALIIAAAVIVAGLAALPFLRQSLLPSFKEPDLLIHLDTAPGTSHPEMYRITARASQELRSIPGVRDVGAHVGRAVFGDQVVNVNSGELWVSLDPAADYDATLAAVQKVVDGYPGLGLHRQVETYLQERSGEVGARPDDSLVVRIYGDNLGVLANQAQVVKQALTGIDGIVDAQVKLPDKQPTFEIEVDLAAAQRYGIKPGDVRRAATTLLSGLQVGSLFEEQKVFDVVVWGTPETRSSLTDVRELLIDTPRGEQVRLGDVAEVRIVPAPTVIQHEAVKSYVDVRAGVQGRGLSSVTRDVERALQGVEFPLEYHAEVLGASAEQQAALPRLVGAAVAAAIWIFLLLQAAYGSWRLAFVAILTLPMALAGGVLAALIGGGVLALGSLFGFLTVLGIAVRNGILMTTHLQHLEQHEGESFGPELVLRGARERLAPILMTALTTGVALLPFVLFGDIAGTEIVRPMAIVILGGLVTCTLLDLFVLPALYLRFDGLLVPATASPQVPEPSLDLA
jgi:CzcA family heavy metal efflux pump